MVRSLFARSSSLDLFTNGPLNGADADAALSMSSQGILASEGMAALAGMGFVSTVNLLVTLEVVKSDKALLAVSAKPLSIAKVGLYMALYILFSAKFFPAFRISACPSPTRLLRILDIGTYLGRFDPSVYHRRVE